MQPIIRVVGKLDTQTIATAFADNGYLFEPDDGTGVVKKSGPIER